MQSNAPGNINVTPLIDVLLVLLIIFMVITPLESRGLQTRVPRESKDEAPQAPAPNNVVITVREDRSVWVNQEPTSEDRLAGRLREVFALAPNGVVFVQGAKSLEFADVARVVDAARGAGITQIALMTGYVAPER